jgi:hypothetical protein
MVSGPSKLLLSSARLEALLFYGKSPILVGQSGIAKGVRSSFTAHFHQLCRGFRNSKAPIQGGHTLFESARLVSGPVLL